MATLKMPGRRQLRLRAHWCLANPTCSVALAPVLNTVMTPVVQRLREISFGRLLDLHGPGRRAGQKVETACLRASQGREPSYC